MSKPDEVRIHASIDPEGNVVLSSEDWKTIAAALGERHRVVYHHHQLVGIREFEHVFSDSGKRIRYRKVPSRLYQDLRKAFPPPEPPTVVGPNGKPELNKADPDYIKALLDYGEEFEQRLRDLIIRRSVVLTIGQEEQAEIDQLKADMAGMGLSVDGATDKELYLWRICITTPEDYKEFMNTLSHRTNPTQEAVLLARESFRTEEQVPASEGADVQGT